jgi:hypothetical protein
MIYLAIGGFILAGIGFFHRSRAAGIWAAVLDTLAAAILGWLSGLLIGVGARIGMWAIPFFNGTEPRITFEGTLQASYIADRLLSAGIARHSAAPLLAAISFGRARYVRDHGYHIHPFLSRAGISPRPLAQFSFRMRKPACK